MVTNVARPTKDIYFIRMATLVATRGTCIRRKVGCILVNVRGHVLATGYNGPAVGKSHCIENPCDGANYKSGHGLEACEAIHGEMNALLQCNDVYEISDCFVTDSPCITCTKLLMNTSCKRIVFANRYAHDEESKKLWLSMSGRTWECLYDS